MLMEDAMYQDFGAREIDDTRQVRFSLFIPDNTLDPGQYRRGGSPNIASAQAIGDFESVFGAADWTSNPQFTLIKSQYTDPEDGITKGWLYELITPPFPGDGFFQYKYAITFNSVHAVQRRQRPELGVRDQRPQNDHAPAGGSPHAGPTDPLRADDR
jgi:hypothetical protein